jgi:hypothetical protein
MAKKKKKTELYPEDNNLTEKVETGDNQVAKKEEKVEPEEDKTLRRQLLSLTARQWTIGKGLKPHKSAGFLFWAGKQFGKNQRKVSPEWQVHWDEFQNRPV